ncbi:hypothetical protein KQX54_019293 [Cotesia glomerata]|uniref:Uncharacterized protein n=1 Tax=Cotesia glomerata TaxID=32391 RepID=A0AAV7J0Q8_COTGL|nr:hypothetical protein KQX54_019293 [Cotesia glomerata]
MDPKLNFWANVAIARDKLNSLLTRLWIGGFCRPMALRYYLNAENLNSGGSGMKRQVAIYVHHRLGDALRVEGPPPSTTKRAPIRGDSPREEATLNTTHEGNL